jgi:hypothetical protein
MPSSISAADKLRCIERELILRYRVYPKRIESGKMTQRQADREIAIMEEIGADYRWLVERPGDKAVAR